MNLETAIKKAQNEGTSPSELSEVRLWLAGEYAFLGGKLGAVLADKPQRWGRLRVEVKSDTYAERLWQCTEQGKEETRLRITLKSIEKLMSAIKTRIEVMQGEARSQF